MAYTPENNPYIPGDPYSYDLKWVVDEIRGWKDPLDSAERAKASEEAAAASAEAAADSAQNSADSAQASADSAATAKNYADNIADPVSGLVTSWLAAHITQPTTPAIDTSLTVAGAAADARATGNAIKPLERALKGNLITYYLSTLASITSDGTDDFDKISGSIFTGVVSLASANRPTNFTSGYVLQLDGAASATWGKVQYLFTSAGRPFMHRSNYQYNGTWTAWTSFYPNTIADLNFTDAFRKVTVIGDSITAGYMPNIGGSGGVTNFDYSWPKYTFKNATFYNCSQGGASVKTFFTDPALNDKLNNIPSDSQAVIIYLGTNNPNLPYGDSTDVIANWNDTPSETWVGYYSKIIKTAQHYAPSAPIIVVGLVWSAERNAAIQAAALGCSALYVSAMSFNTGEWNIANNNDGTHVTAIGYIGVSNVMKKCINSVIYNNLAAFNHIQVI